MDLDLQIVPQLISQIWETTLALPIEPVEPTANAAGRTTAACIQITGAWNGAVLLDCSAEVARDAASTMFSLPVADVSVLELQDAVAELVNMIGGNFKALLPEKCFLSLPAVVEGGDFSSRIPRSHLVGQWTFLCASHPITISIREKDEQPSLAAA